MAQRDPSIVIRRALGGLKNSRRSEDETRVDYGLYFRTEPTQMMTDKIVFKPELISSRKEYSVALLE